MSMTPTFENEIGRSDETGSGEALLKATPINGALCARAASRGIPLLIILAPPRCYTTLVCAMIGRHPEMYGLPETHLWTSQTMAEWWISHQGTDRTDGLSRAVAEIIFKSQTEGTVRLAQQWLRRPYQTTGDILRALARRVSPRILVEKTPQATERIEHMQRIVCEFPQARFLHLLRHPFGQVLSRIERRRKKFAEASPAMDLVEAAQNFGGADPQMLWYRCNSNIVTFLNTVEPEQQMRIRGEDLLAAPDKHLREIAMWLNLRSDTDAIEAMKHPENSPFAGFGPPNARMGGTRISFTGRHSNPSSLARKVLTAVCPGGRTALVLRPGFGCWRGVLVMSDG